MILDNIKTLIGSFDMTNIPVELQGYAYLIQETLLFLMGIVFFMWVVKSILLLFSLPKRIISGGK